MRKLALALALASMVVLAGQPASAQFSLGGIRNSLVQWVLDKISIEDIFEITVQEVQGTDEGTTLVGVQITDVQGVWFTADTLSFDFNRTRLLRGQLFIDNLTARGVEVFRQPVIAPGEEIEVNLEGTEAPPDPDTPFYWPRSPITAAVEQMVLDDVHLHAGVLGQDLTFDATGSFRDQDEVQSARLELQRTDEVEGVIDFAYSRDFDANTLSVELEAAEQPGGLVSELAGLPPEAPVAITVLAEGTPDAFQTTFDLGITDFLQAEGTATVDYAGPLAVDAQFTARPGPLMPDEYAQLLGDQAELVVRAQEGPDQTVRIETARITSPYLAATVDGTYSRATGAVDAQVALVAEPGLGDPFPTVDFAGLRFDGRIQGEPGSFTADGDLVLDGFTSPQLAVDGAVLDIDASQSGTADAPTTTLTTSGRVTGLRLDQVGPDVIGEATIRLAASLTGDEVVLRTAAIESEPLDIAAQGVANITTGDFDVTFDAAAPELGPVLGAYGIEGDGEIVASGQAVSQAGVLTLTTTADLIDFDSTFGEAERLHLKGTVLQSPDRTTFNLTGNADGLGIGELDSGLVGRADLALSGSMAGDVVTLDAARIDSAALDATAEGQLNMALGTGQIDFRLDSENLAPAAAALDVELGGAMTATGAVTLSTDGFSLATTAEFDDLTGLIETDALRLQASVEQAGERTGFSVTGASQALTVRLGGEELSGPVEIALAGVLDGDALALDTARITSPILDATAEGAVDLAQFTGDLTYDVRTARLDALAPLLGVDAEGVLTAQGGLGVTPEQPATPVLEGTAAIADLSLMGAEIGDLAAEYDIALTEAPTGTLQLVLTDSPYAPDGPTTFGLTMSGPPSAWSAAFDLSAPNYLQAQGEATVAWADQVSVSARATATPGPALPQEYAQLLGEQAELVVEARQGADQTVQIETARISSPVLNATVGGTYALDTGVADLDVQLVAEPELAAPFEGVDFAGLRFDGQVQGAPGSLAAQGDLALDGFVSGQLSVGQARLAIEAAQTGPADAPVVSLSANGVAQGLVVAGIGPEVFGDARLALDASLSGTELTLTSAQIESDLLTLTATGAADIGMGEFEVSYDLAAPDLAPLLGNLGMDGTGSLAATGLAVSEDGALRLTTSADLTGFTSDFASAERLHLEGVVVSGDVTEFDLTGFAEGLGVAGLEPDGRAELALSGALDGDVLALDAATVEAPGLTATAQGRLNLADSTGAVDFRVVSDELRPLAEAFDVDLTGALAATGTATLTPQGVQLETEAALTNLAGVVQAETLQLQASVDQAGERTAFDMTASSDRLTVDLGEDELTGPVDLAVQGAMEGDLLALRTARVESPILNATASGTVNLADMTGDLTYEIEAARLAAIAPLLGVEAEGLLSAQGALELAGAGEETAPRIVGAAAVEDLSVLGLELGDLTATHDVRLADAPQGTLRLTLTDSPYAPEAPTVFALEMAGTPAGWNLDFDLTAPDYLQARGEATIAWAEELSVSARATATPGPALPEEYAQLLGDEAELVVEARQGADQTVEIETARISSPVLNATVAGTYVLDTGAADLEIQLVAEPELAAPFEGVDFAGLRFGGQVQGAPGSLTADGDLVLDGFASGQLSVDQATLSIDVAQTGPAEAPVTGIRAQGLASGLTVAGIGPEVLGDARLTVDAALVGDELAINAARVESDLLTLTAEGMADISTMAFEVSYDLAAPRLAPLLDSFGMNGTGSLAATGLAVSDDDAVRLTTSADLADFTSDFASARRLHLEGVVVSREATEFDLTGFAEGLGVAGFETEGRAELALTGALDGDVLALDAASVTSPGLTATAEGRLNLADSTGAIDFSVVSEDLGELAEGFDVDLTGALAATGQATLTPEGMELATTADLTDLDGVVQADALRLQATVEQSGERTSFAVTGASEEMTVALAGAELTGPAELAARGAIVGETLTLDAARVSSPIIEATAEGTLDLGDMTGALTYDIDAALLGALSPLLGVDAAGLLTAQGVLELSAGAPALDGAAAIADLSVMGIEIGDLAAVHDIALAETPQGTLRLTLTDSPYAPEAPTVVTLGMSGPPEAWALDFDLIAPNHLTAEGDATVSWEAPLSVEARLTATPGPALPEQYAQLLGEQAELVVEASEGEDQTIRIDTARITSPVLNASVEGTYSTATGAADLEVELVAEPELAAPFEGVAFDGLRFDGRVQGEPGSLSAEGDLALDGFASEQLAVDSAVLEIDVGQTGTAEAPTTNLDVQGRATGLRVAGMPPETVGDANIALDASLAGDVLTIETARIDSGVLQLWADGSVNVSTMEFDLDYNVAAAQVGPLAEALLGMQLGGAVTAAGTATSEGDALTLDTRAEITNLTSDYADAQRLTIQGTIAQDGDRLAFDVTGSGAGLRIDQIGGDLIGDADFAADGVLDGEVLTLETARISSPLLTATAQGEVNLQTGEGRLTYDVDAAALGPIGQLFDVPVTGTVSAEGVLGLAAASDAAGPRLVGEAAVANLAYAGTQVGDVRLAHDVVLSDNPSGALELAVTSGPYAPAAVDAAFRMEGDRLILSDLEASAFGVAAAGDLTVNLDTFAADGALRLRATEGPFAPAEATAQVRLQGDRLTLGNLRAQALGLAAAGDLVVDLNTLTAEGTLRVDDADLTRLGAVIGAPVAGEAEGTIRLSAEGGRQAAALDLMLFGVSAYNVAIGQARVEGRIADLLGAPRVDLNIAAEQIVSGNITLATAAITAAGPISSLGITLRGVGDMGMTPLAVQATATADLAGAAARVTVGNFDLTLGDERVSLLAPLTVVSRGAALVVEDMAIALPDGGRLTGDIAYYGGPLVGDIVLDAPDLSVAARLFDLPIDGGALRLAGTFDTRPGSAGADLTVTGRNIVFTDIVESGVLGLDGRLQWDGRIANLDFRVMGDFDQPLIVTAAVPVVPNAGGLPQLAESGPVSARVDWQGEIGDLWALVPAPGHVVTGDARIDLGVSGDISNPVFTGGILLANGTYQNLDYGTILTGISVATEIESTGGLALRLDAVDGAAGAVRVSGRIGLGEQGIDLTVETRRAIVVRREDAIVRVDADIRIVQQPEVLLIEGRAAILEAEVRLLLDNPPEIVTLGEVRIKGQPIVDETGGFDLPIRLQIDVTSPGDAVFVRGRGLDSQWGANLQVRGTAAEPRITGEIAAVRGELDLLGRDFDLERGRVIFNGGRTIDPRLDVSLVRETDEITGRIIVTGTASDPELSFQSTPDLPEDEVLPLLLFGTPAQALTPAQGVQLALGLATLLNGGGGTLDQFRAALGLDTLGIEQDSEGAAVAIGKQVTDDVWVGTQQSLEGGGTSVAVEIEIFDNVEVYGEASTEGESTVGIQWKKDF